MEAVAAHLSQQQLFVVIEMSMATTLTGHGKVVVLLQAVPGHSMTTLQDMVGFDFLGSQVYNRDDHVGELQ